MMSLKEPPPAVSLRLRAPLVLHNLLCAPMLYRIVNRQGLISAEGVLPVGASVPLHRVDLCQKQYASFLLVNYPWSDFIKVHSPTSAHPMREKVREVEVRGLKVSVPAEPSSSSAASKKGRELPGLHLHVALQVCFFVLSGIRKSKDGRQSSVVFLSLESSHLALESSHLACVGILAKTASFSIRPFLLFFLAVVFGFEQGRDLSVFSRLWLVNRTEMTLQHRDSSLAGGIDSTFIGDRMPQITQPGPRQEAESTTESVAATSGGGDGGAGDDHRLGLSPPASEGARTPTKVKGVV